MSREVRWSEAYRLPALGQRSVQHSTLVLVRPYGHSTGIRRDAADTGIGTPTEVVFMFLPGAWVEVRSPREILATLDARQSIEGLPFMPEMLRHCGRRYRVALRAERVCTFPPSGPFRQLDDALVLDGLRCDGSSHAACQLGCMLLWKERWLRAVPGGADQPSAANPDGETSNDSPVPSGEALRSTTDPNGETYFCQATELIRATRPGEPIWKPGQYLRFLRLRTFSPGELGRLAMRVGRRVAARLARRLTRRASPATGAVESTLGLERGDWVEVKGPDEIARTLDARGRYRGMPFGGDMHEQCGHRMRVEQRVGRIIDERTGRLRAIPDTVILEGSVCDRYFGCARGMPFLWREAWLRRARPDAVSAPVPGRAALAVKRGIDVSGAVVALTVLAPVLAWVALAIVATEGPPILFRQQRPGLRGKPFTIFKFRTMRDPRPGEVWYMTDDQRLTHLGRLLRATSIDELPELWNVIRGDMSLVGPRPLLFEYMGTYTPEQRRRHDVRPGVTGWAAVNGRHALRFEDRVALDVWYVDNWSLWLDIRIVFMTVAQVMRRTDVSATQDLEEVGFPLPGVGGLPLDAKAGEDQPGRPPASDQDAERQTDPLSR